MTKDSPRPPRKPLRVGPSTGTGVSTSSTAVPAVRGAPETGSIVNPAQLVRDLIVDRDLAGEERFRALMSSLAGAFERRDDATLDGLVEAGYELVRKDQTRRRPRIPVELQMEFRFYAVAYFAFLKREIATASSLVEDMPDDPPGRLARAAVAAVSSREALARTLVTHRLRERSGSGEPPLRGEARLIELIEMSVLIL